MCDTEYWSKFYKTDVIKTPSSFCKYVIDLFANKEKCVLDAGFGNGRDSYELSKHFKVTGVDMSGYIPPNTDTCTFKFGNFCTIPKDAFDIIYSRFTFHSIPNEDQETFVKSITKPLTTLCIETRSDKGIQSHRHHGNDHYRNFTNVDYLKKLLSDNNFEITYIEENHGFAPYKDEDPICIRTVAIKR